MKPIDIEAEIERLKAKSDWSSFCLSDLELLLDLLQRHKRLREICKSGEPTDADCDEFRALLGLDEPKGE